MTVVGVCVRPDRGEPERLQWIRDNLGAQSARIPIAMETFERFPHEVANIVDYARRAFHGSEIPILVAALTDIHPGEDKPVTAQKRARYVRVVQKMVDDLELPIIELWNEPNQATFAIRAGDPRAGDFARLLRACEEPLREVRPDIEIVAGGLAPGRHGTKNMLWDVFLRRFYNLDKVDVVDAWAFHPYGDTGLDSWRMVEAFRKLLDARRPDLPLYLTEWGWGTGVTTPRRPRPVTEGEDAKWTRDFLALARRDAKRLNVRGVWRYMFMDDVSTTLPAPEDGRRWADSAGLIRQGGTPKASAHAFFEGATS